MLIFVVIDSVILFEHVLQNLFYIKFTGQPNFSQVENLF